MGVVNFVGLSPAVFAVVVNYFYLTAVTEYTILSVISISPFFFYLFLHQETRIFTMLFLIQHNFAFVTRNLLWSFSAVGVSLKKEL